MGIIDIVVILLTLIFILIGFKKGFFKQLLSFANWFLALIVSMFLVKPFTELISKTPVHGAVNNRIVAWIATKGPEFSQEYIAGAGSEQISEAISEGLNLPKFIADLVANGINFDVPDGTTIADILAPSITHIVLYFISYLILFFGLMIILKITLSFFDKLFDKGVLGAVNQVFGGVLGAVKAFIIVSVAILILSIVGNLIPSVHDFLVSDLKLDEDKFRLSKLIYEYNPLIELFKGFISFENILDFLTLNLIIT